MSLATLAPCRLLDRKRDMGGDAGNADAHFIERRLRQFQHSRLVRTGECARPARLAIEHPGHAQALRKTLVVRLMGQSLEADDFAFRRFTGKGQSADELALDA